MEAQAVERCQRTTEEEFFQINCYPSRQSRTQSDGVAATLKRLLNTLLSQGLDIPGGWKLIRTFIKARISLKSERHLYINIEAPPGNFSEVSELNNISVVTEIERAG